MLMALLLWCFPGIMRLVASLAVDAVGVIGRYYLGKVLWFRPAGLVALHTQSGSFRENGYDAHIVGMPALGAMTGFAMDAAMWPGREFVVFFGVTGGADGAAREGDRPLTDIVERRSAVMSVLTESGGDRERPNREKSQYSHRHQNDQTH